MNFSKEQKDYIIHALEHCEVLTGGRSSGKTLELIKQQEKEIKRLNNIINELDKQNKELGIELSITKDNINKAIFFIQNQELHKNKDTTERITIKERELIDILGSDK